MALTTPDDWLAERQGERPRRGFAHFEEVARHLPRRPGLSFFEVGCAPGGILAEFCLRLDAEAHGIDFAADPRAVAAYLTSEGVRVGAIHQGDFLAWEPPRRYDVVASFGFVEHFEDAAGVLDRHFALVEPGGCVVVTLPNFARGQKLLHWLFDRENLRLHNTRCMNLSFLRAAAARNGVELLEARYVGGPFGFWLGKGKRSWLALRLAWRTEAALERLVPRLWRGENPWFSPCLAAVYRAPGGEFAG